MGNYTKGIFWFPYNGAYSLASKFCFIPTASGLDIADFNTTSLSGSYVNGAASVSTSRTGGFLAQEKTVVGSSTSYNQPHLTFNARNGEWIFDQMQNDLQKAASIACSTECSAVASITGPTQICTSPTSVFTINATQATWTASPSNLFTVTSGSGSQFSTAAASGAQGSGTITASFSCGPSVTKTVSVGGAYPTGQYRYNGSYYNLTGTQFVGYNNPITIFLNQSYNFTFTSDNPNVTLSTGGNSTTFSIPTSVNQVKITATAAGTSSDCAITGGFIFVPNGYSYQVAPNPASSELTVSDGSAGSASPAAASTSSSAAGSSTPATRSFLAELYDTYGKQVKTQQSTQGRAVLNVRDVPNGLYNLRVGTDAKAYSQHVQISH